MDDETPVEYEPKESRFCVNIEWIQSFWSKGTEPEFANITVVSLPDGDVEVLMPYAEFRALISEHLELKRMDDAE